MSKEVIIKVPRGTLGVDLSKPGKIIDDNVIAERLVRKMELRTILDMLIHQEHLLAEADAKEVTFRLVEATTVSSGFLVGINGLFYSFGGDVIGASLN